MLKAVAFVTHTDDLGNSYQVRNLDNGTTHKVLKNFPTENFIRQLLAEKLSDINFINLQYYWILNTQKFEWRSQAGSLSAYIPVDEQISVFVFIFGYSFSTGLPAEVLAKRSLNMSPLPGLIV